MTIQWPPWGVTSSLRNLEKLRDLVEFPQQYSLEAEPLGWLCRLLVVRSCGYLEITISECARGFVQHKSGGLVKTFALTWLERSRNPSPVTMLELAGRFDALLRDDLEALLHQDDGILHEAIAGLVERRNRIAHGHNEGVNRDRALSLTDAAVTVADWWIVSLNPL